jgi:thiamine biosynthesis lipoprotein
VRAEVERLEDQLSFYRESSDISDLNARAANEEVPVDPRLFTLLERAGQWSEATDGAFDVTVAPLVRCWGFAGGTGALPTEEAIAAALSVVGMHHVRLNKDDYTVRYDREGVTLELGAIGKGYAVDRAVELLREYEIESALLHGGTSTVYGLGAPPETDGWIVAIQQPFAPAGAYLAQVTLRDKALSVSAPHGKWFEQGGKKYGHVLDPRTGFPVRRSVLAALVTASATDSDALSTALLARGAEWLPSLLQICPKGRALVATQDLEGGLQVVAAGIEVSGTGGGAIQ